MSTSPLKFVYHIFKPIFNREVIYAKYSVGRRTGSRVLVLVKMNMFYSVFVFLIRIVPLNNKMKRDVRGKEKKYVPDPANRSVGRTLRAKTMV